MQTRMFVGVTFLGAIVCFSVSAKDATTRADSTVDNLTVKKTMTVNGQSTFANSVSIKPGCAFSIKGGGSSNRFYVDIYGHLTLGDGTGYVAVASPMTIAKTFTVGSDNVVLSAVADTAAEFNVPVKLNKDAEVGGDLNVVGSILLNGEELDLSGDATLPDEATFKTLTVDAGEETPGSFTVKGLSSFNGCTQLAGNVELTTSDVPDVTNELVVGIPATFTGSSVVIGSSEEMGLKTKGKNKIKKWMTRSEDPLLTVNGGTSITGALAVDGATQLNGGAEVTGDLNVVGNILMNGEALDLGDELSLSTLEVTESVSTACLDVTDSALIHGDLVVDGTIYGSLDSGSSSEGIFSGDVVIGGNTEVAGTVTIYGTRALNDKCEYEATKSLYVDGDTTLEGDVLVANGKLRVFSSSVLDEEGEIITPAGLEVHGDTSLGGEVTIADGKLTILKVAELDEEGDPITQDGLTVGGNTSLEEDVSVGGDLSVIGDVWASGGLFATDYHYIGAVDVDLVADVAKQVATFAITTPQTAVVTLYYLADTTVDETAKKLFAYVQLLVNKSGILATLSNKTYLDGELIDPSLLTIGYASVDSSSSAITFTLAGHATTNGSLHVDVMLQNLWDA